MFPDSSTSAGIARMAFFRRDGGDALEPPVVALGEMFLQPDVQHDEQIAAPHLLQLQLRHAFGPVEPADRDGAERVAADDRLERQFHRQVEVIREDRPQAVDDLAPVALERVRRVVERNAEQQRE